MKMKNVCMFFLINICIVIQGGAATASENAPGPANIAELKQELEKARIANHIPGIGIVLISKGTVEWEGGLGMADPAAKRPVDADTVFRTGSISKSFVGLAALKLQEEGKLNLNDTFRKWAPGIALENRWEATEPVRLVHLLEHTAGLNDISIREYANNEAQPVPLAKALALYPAERKTRWIPGSRFSYSNMGPALMAHVIEKASGQRFEDYIQQNFFDPIGMRSATYFHPGEKRFAGQYDRDGQTRLPYWNILYRPSGSVNASVHDMTAYLRFFLARGRAGDAQLLTPASIARMERCETLPMCRQGVQVGYGLHNYGTLEDGMRFQGHDGAVSGALAFMGYLPQQQSGFVVLLNAATPGAAHIRRLVTGYLARQLGAPAPAAGVTQDKDTIARFSGYYRGAAPRLEQLHGVSYLLDIMKLTLDDKGLTLSFPVSGYSERWVALPNGLYRKTWDPEATVALYVDAAGRPHMQSAQGTAQRVSGLAALGPVVLAAACFALVLSAPLFALVWGIRKLAGRLAAPGPLRVRVLPLLASLALLATVGAFAAITMASDPIPLAGAPTLQSIVLFASGIVFVALSGAAAATVWRQRRSAMHRGAYWHSALVTVACVASAGYLLSWGLIGTPSWGM